MYPGTPGGDLANGMKPQFQYVLALSEAGFMP